MSKLAAGTYPRLYARLWPDPMVTINDYHLGLLKRGNVVRTSDDPVKYVEKSWQREIAIGRKRYQFGRVHETGLA